MGLTEQIEPIEQADQALREQVTILVSQLQIAVERLQAVVVLIELWLAGDTPAGYDGLVAELRGWAEEINPEQRETLRLLLGPRHSSFLLGQ